MNRQERYDEIKAWPNYGWMSSELRECTRYLRDDLYRLDESKAEEHGGDYDCLEHWRYVSPGKLRVTLRYTEQTDPQTGLYCRINGHDGRLIAETHDCTLGWLDEECP